MLSLTATRDLARRISTDNPQIEDAFDAAIRRGNDLDDPTFASVIDPQGRLRIEVLQQSIDVIRSILAEEVGPALGIAAGFNSLDGD